MSHRSKELVILHKLTCGMLNYAGCHIW